MEQNRDRQVSVAAYRLEFVQHKEEDIVENVCKKTFHKCSAVPAHERICLT